MTRSPLFLSTAGAALLLGLLPRTIPAQECAVPATIAADRPGNITLPLVLSAGHVQVEVGGSRTTVGEVHATTVGSSLVRVGLSCAVELRIATGGWASLSGTGTTSSSVADFWVGTKVRLRRGSGATPHLALMTGSLVPSRTVVSHQRFEPELDLIAMWDLPRGQGLVAFTGLARRWDAGRFVGERMSAASWTFPVGPLASFAEYSEFARPGAVSRFVATGLQFFPRATVQLDASVIIPVPRAGSDASFGLGFSRRTQIGTRPHAP